VRIYYDQEDTASIYLDLDIPTAIPASARLNSKSYSNQTFVFYSLRHAAKNYVKNMLEVPENMIEEFEESFK
jgi:hypothetical protein